MYFLNSLMSTTTHPFSAIPLLASKKSSTLKEDSFRPLFSPFLLRRTPSRTLRISAHSTRRTNRQNYLRKKLTQQRQQLHRVSHLQHPPHESNKTDISQSDFGSSSTTSVGRLDESGVELRRKQFGESIMWSKLENWVEQYKKDSEFWGKGIGPIFFIYEDSKGKIERVDVNEDEILRRSGVDPQFDTGMDEVNFKISFANDLAREMENGGNTIQKSSSVAKFLQSGRKSSLLETVQSVAWKPVLFSKMSKAGLLVLCGLFIVWASRGLFAVREDNEKYTRLEKEMLHRKLKARMDKEHKVKGCVEVVLDPIDAKSLSFERPRLDKEELVNNIVTAKKLNSKFDVQEPSASQNKKFNDKIEEIRAMARNVREMKKGDTLPRDGEECNNTLEEFPSSSALLESNILSTNMVRDNDSDESTVSLGSNNPEIDVSKSTAEASDEKHEDPCYDIPGVVTPNCTGNSRPEVSKVELVLKPSVSNEVNLHSDGPGCQSGPDEDSSRKKLRIIKSAKEAKEYLSRKKHKLEMNKKQELSKEGQSGNVLSVKSTNTPLSETYPLNGMHDLSHLSEDNSMSYDVDPDHLKKSSMSYGHEGGVNNKGFGLPEEIHCEKEKETKKSYASNCINEKSPPLSMEASTSNEVDWKVSITRDEMSSTLKKQNLDKIERNEFVDPKVSGSTSINEVKKTTADLQQPVTKENWIEKNFHEFEPIVKKIGSGFRDSYLAAREKASQELDLKLDISQLKPGDAKEELEWMNDERLREIVFRVRDNELSGREPFHLMGEEDKSAFFRGLEKKVEKENAELQNLHEYLHSNIENLDYGSNGISVYDPPEKIIPRWKVPPAERNPEFLKSFAEQKNSINAESLKNAFLSMTTVKDGIQKLEEPASQNTFPVARDVSTANTELKKDGLASSKTIIEGSDGSVRKGKRSGMEFWQHTKKWSEGFLESYNAETDPEVKAVMKDMGKDLDRWITEKEIQEAAELMDKLPEKGQKFIKQKLDKVKREMELFGPQAVVSKYREYAEEKEEDYLWWLDLPFVLCIELYTVENGEQTVGFYSLEMAADLELDPKQHHVIAFEDASDCKNFCYIIQAHMEMLGNGNAFVVARPPKDAFREAKANGFSVTVIRKGQLQLNVDLMLEEVEESIVEIGSKIYHDKIMKERGVGINTLMKGVFGVPGLSKRKRTKRKLKRRFKH